MKNTKSVSNTVQVSVCDKLGDASILFRQLDLLLQLFCIKLWVVQYAAEHFSCPRSGGSPQKRNQDR